MSASVFLPGKSFVPTTSTTTRADGPAEKTEHDRGERRRRRRMCDSEANPRAALTTATTTAACGRRLASCSTSSNVDACSRHRPDRPDPENWPCLLLRWKRRAAHACHRLWRHCTWLQAADSCSEALDWTSMPKPDPVSPPTSWGRSTVHTACPLDCPDSCSLDRHRRTWARDRHRRQPRGPFDRRLHLRQGAPFRPPPLRHRPPAPPGHPQGPEGPRRLRARRPGTKRSTSSSAR